MIIAEIYEQSDGKIAGFVIRGHSEGGGHGYNVHCAEVSMLSQSAYLGVRQYLNREVAAENNEHGGLGVELKDAPDECTEAVFQTMLIGLRAIEEVAPKDVKVEIRKIDSATEADLQQKLGKMTPTPAKPLPNVEVKGVKIRAEIYRDAEKILGFSVEERKGRIGDNLKIYYASVRSLVNAAFLCVKDHLKRDVKTVRSPRKLAVKLKTPPDVATEAVFQTLLIGMTEVEKLAPQIVKVREKFLLGGENK